MDLCTESKSFFILGDRPVRLDIRFDSNIVLV